MTAAGPVIPNFGEGSSCVVDNHLFCWGWVRDNWSGTLEPALVQHIELALIAVGIGFAIALVLAFVSLRFRRFDHPFGLFSDFLYTIPSLALFQLLVPITGLTVTTVEVALVSYTLFILYRNIYSGLTGVPAEVLEAAQAMGMTRTEVLRRIELPLALPTIMAGLRIATVSTISIATVAALVLPKGLGYPIYNALGNGVFKTEIIAAGALTIGLALAADGLLLLTQRALTPWARLART
jgi:osmoprotectant transport system permease protein